MHPVDMIFYWARSNPEQPALIQPDMVMTYREIAEAIQSVATRVAQFGFIKDEPVAVSIHQPIQKLIVCCALLRLGLSVAPVSPGALPHLRVNGIYNLIFTGEGMMLSGGRNIRFDDGWMKGARNVILSGSAGVADNADVVFLRTGSSGPEKLIMPSGALMARLRVLPLIGEANYGAALIAQSLDSASGFFRACVNLYAGRTACFGSNLESCVLLVKLFNIDTLVCSAATVRDLVSFVASNKNSPIGSLHEIWVEDGLINRELGVKIQSHLCRNLITGYGSVETGRITFANFDMIADTPNAAGFVVPGATVEVVDNDDVPLPQGREGRVRCRSEVYRRVVAANATDRAVLSDTVWQYPGVSGRLGADGMLYVQADTQPRL